MSRIVTSIHSVSLSPSLREKSAESGGVRRAYGTPLVGRTPIVLSVAAGTSRGSGRVARPATGSVDAARTS